MLITVWGNGNYTNSTQTSSQFVLKGIYSDGQIEMFSILDNLNNASCWLKTGQSLGDLKVLSYDAKQQSVLVRIGTVVHTLELEDYQNTSIAVLGIDEMPQLSAAAKRGQSPDRSLINIPEEQQKKLNDRAALRDLRVELQSELNEIGSIDSSNTQSDNAPYLAPAIPIAEDNEDLKGPQYVRVLRLREEQD